MEVQKKLNNVESEQVIWLESWRFYHAVYYWGSCPSGIYSLCWGRGGKCRRDHFLIKRILSHISWQLRSSPFPPPPTPITTLHHSLRTQSGALWITDAQQIKSLPLPICFSFPSHWSHLFGGLGKKRSVGYTIPQYLFSRSIVGINNWTVSFKYEVSYKC